MYDFPQNWRRKPVIISEDRLKVKGDKIYYNKLGQKINIKKDKMVFIIKNNNNFKRLKDQIVNIELMENNNIKYIRITPYKGKKFLAKKSLLQSFFINNDN